MGLLRSRTSAWAFGLAAAACGSDAAGSAGNTHVRSPAALERGTTPDRVAATDRSHSADVAAPAPVQKDLPAFLVHTEGGAVVERGATTPSQTLIPHADTVLYDAALELLWYIESNQLLVLDLRARSAAPELIVRDMKDSDRLTVMRGGHIVADRDGCESPYAVLEWTEKPKVKLMLDDSGARVKIDGGAWLKAQLTRAERSVPAASLFGAQTVSLPASLLACEEEETCGASVPFADRGWQLVLVTDRSGGDCWERACLLHNPKADRFATPPGAQAWLPAAAAKPGSCGPYRFDPSRTAYLVERWLCVGDRPCEELAGQALGWLEPGETVGE